MDLEIRLEEDQRAIVGQDPLEVFAHASFMATIAPTALTLMVTCYR